MWCFSPIEFIKSLVGTVITQNYVSSPFMILVSITVFKAIEILLENIIRILGKRNWQVFMQVSRPFTKKLQRKPLENLHRRDKILSLDLFYLFSPTSLSLPIYNTVFILDFGYKYISYQRKIIECSITNKL